jgi:hypothetical protein
VIAGPIAGIIVVIPGGIGAGIAAGLGVVDVSGEELQATTASATTTNQQRRGQTAQA